MALVDVDVAFDIMDSYMMRITCMLRENRVNDFSGCYIYIYRLYRWYEFYLRVIFYEDMIEIDKLTEVTSIEYLITL